MNWLTTVLALFQLAPKVIDLVNGVETAIGSAPGETKKAVVMAPLAMAGAPPHVVSGVSMFVDHFVQARKNVPAPVAQVPAPSAPAVVPAPTLGTRI